MAKRTNGEGTIRQRADGRWEIRFILRNGKRRSVYGLTQRETKDKYKAELKLDSAGVDLSRKPETVDTFMTAWLRDVVEVQKAPRTSDGYARYHRLYISPALGSIKLRDLKLSDVERMLRGMTAAGKSPRTVAQCRAILRAAMNHAIRSGLIDRNPAQYAKPPAQEKHEPQYLQADEAQRLLKAALEHDPDLWPQLAVALYTGMRFGELAGLAWSSVNLEARRLRVVRTTVRVNGSWQFGEPKSKSSRRILSLPQPAIDALTTQRDKQAFTRRKAGDRWQDYDLVFTNAVGGPVDPSSCGKRLHRLLDLAGLPKMGWHALRHSCASLLVSSGIPMRAVSEQLGHSQMALTSDLYSHVAPAMLAENAAALERAMRKSG